MAWARRLGKERVAYAVLALALLIAAALILWWGRGQTFINDEWSYLVDDRGWALETLLKPQNGHLIVVPLLLYKAMFATFGASAHLPYQAAAVVLHLTVAALFFLLVRGRLPLAASVALAVLVAFFGAGWDTVMGAYELPNLLGMAAGLGMLLALERRTALGDVAACALLTISLASFSIGLAFAAAALVAIWLGGRSQWHRAWLALAPFVLWTVWFLWARKFGQSEVTAEALGGIFSGMADQMAAILASITGLFRVPGSAELSSLIEVRQVWGYPLAVIFVALIVLHLRRAPRSIRFWTVTGMLIAYLALVAVGLSPARAPNASRYAYMGSILALLLVAELAADIRWSTVTGLVAFVLFALALAANVAELRVGGHLFEAEGATNRATLAALELSRDRVDPSFFAEGGSEMHSHPDMFFPASAYFEATNDFGSPAFSPKQLLDAGEQAREAADEELVHALGLSARPVDRPAVGRGAAPELLFAADGGARSIGPCVALRPDLGRTGSFQLELPPAGFTYRVGASAKAEVKLGRFADATAIPLPAVTGSAEIAIPTDASDVPWRAELRIDQRTLVCPVRVRPAAVAAQKRRVQRSIR